jgi:transposase
VLADRAYDSDPLRERLAAAGYQLFAHHRASSTKPPANDGRRLRRLKRWWVVERSIAWLKSFRRVHTRYEV